MKVVVQCNYDPEVVGGIATVTLSLIKILAGLSVRPVVLGGTESEHFEDRQNYIFFGYRVLFRLWGAPFLLFGNIRFIYHCLNAKLVIFQEPYPTLLPSVYFVRFILRKDVVVLVHAIPAMPSFLNGLYFWVRSLLLNHCFTVTTSPVLLEQLGLTQMRDTQVIPLAFDDHKAKASANPNKREFLDTHGIPERYMLFLGRLSGYKGIPVLLDAISTLPHIPFVIAGTGVESDKVQRAIDTFGFRNVLFINRYVSEDEKFELIRNSSVFLLPSVNSSEAFGITQLEAMYFSRPIVNTRLENGVNFVAPSGEVAKTVSPGDSQELASAISELWHNPETAAALGQNGKKRLEQLFTNEAFEEAWRKLLYDHLKRMDR